MPTKTGNVLNWASDLDNRALEQAQRAAALPFVDGHVALMADAHVGLGATIGSVIPTKGAIIPAAVGVDLGCGMIATRLDLTSADLPDDLSPLHNMITRSVPAGVGQGHMTKQQAKILDDPRTENLSDKQKSKAAKQLGTLGSGNHFVEICLDETDQVWIVLHSGSRGIGNQLATSHIQGAKKLMRDHFIELEDPDLAYLVQDTPEFDAYVRDMRWAQDYALINRQVMMDAVHSQVEWFLNRPVATDAPINCHHNFCEMEHHNGRDVWITRKGAIRARSGDLGVIPGSMGTQSYIVRGLGSDSSYHSSSHGAGRRMSRRKARETLDVAGLAEQMGDRAWNTKHAHKLIDEDPRAYKDIDQVMADQQDLVEVVHSLRQILNYKGL